MIHAARVRWVPFDAGGLKSLPPVLRVIALSRFEEDGPRWTDEKWSVVLFFEQPPIEQVERDCMAARVAFAFEHAPQERLHTGAHFAIYYGRTRIADVDVLD